MQPNNIKAPLCAGLLAHVGAGGGGPHFYSPEKYGFLSAFFAFWGYIDFNLYFAEQSALPYFW